MKFLDGQYACPTMELLAALMLDVVDMPPFTVDEVMAGDEPCVKPTVSNLFSCRHSDMISSSNACIGRSQKANKTMW